MEGMKWPTTSSGPAHARSLADPLTLAPAPFFFHLTAAASLKKLLNTLSILDVGKRTLYSTNRRAVWHKNLGIAYVNTNDWVLGQSHLMEALRLLEFPGPTTRKELQAALIKQTRRQQKYWTKRNEEYVRAENTGL